MKKFFKSIVVGASLVIPGVCSATTSIILGVYEDMLAVFSNLFRFSKLKKYFVICLGLMIGLILGVSVIKILYDKIPFISNMVFFGVIISLFPYRIKQKRHINKIYILLFLLLAFH